MSERLEIAKTAIDWDWEKIPPDVQVHLKWLIERTEKFEEVINIFKNGGEYWLDEMEGEMSDE